jgi:hypothetical protein
MVDPATIDPAHPIDPAHLGQLETALERELTERKKAHWTPRKYQEAAWNFLRSGGKRAYLVWHRRAGKDDVCLRHTLQALQERPGGYWYLLPQQEQARKAIWRAVDPHKGKRRIDISFPPALREKTLDQEMLIQFKKWFDLAGARQRQLQRARRLATGRNRVFRMAAK